MGHDDCYLYSGRLIYLKKGKIKHYRRKKIKFKKRSKERGLVQLSLDFSFFGKK